MSQRRSGNASDGKSGQPGGERSDLTDVKAMAARTRSRTGSVSVPAQLPVGVGSAPSLPSITPSNELPGWFWGVLGCLSVLVVGFAGLWWAASSGFVLKPLEAMTARAGFLGAGPAGTSAGGRRGHIQVEPMAARIADPVPMLPMFKDDKVETRRPAPRDRSPAAPAGASRAARAPTARAVAANEQPGRDQTGDDDDKKAAEAPSKQTAAREGGPAAREAEASPREAPPAAEAAPSREAAVLREISGPDEERPREAAPQETVEAALTALAPKVRRCFFKFQIPGKAQVKLVAPPTGGAAESVTVSGDFEGTPTGECVAAEIGGASLPAFKGSPVRVSHTYVLR